MQQTNKHAFESDGFRAHNYLTKESSRRRTWPYLATSKLTATLVRKRVSWKKVGTAHRKSNVVASEQLSLDFDLKGLFQSLADQWHTDTEHMSNLIKACNHPAYQQIIGMGKIAPSLIVPLILRELRERPDHWFAALHEISGEDPSASEDGFDEAIEAWMSWGKRKHYVN